MVWFLCHTQHASNIRKKLKDIDAAIETAACSYLLASDEAEEEDIEEQIEDEHIQDLLAVQEIIAAPNLSHDTSAGRHDIDVLDAYIYEYPETAFLALFARIVGYSLYFRYEVCITNTFGRDPHISCKHVQDGEGIVAEMSFLLLPLHPSKLSSFAHFSQRFFLPQCGPHLQL
ncbi:hypothetical protein L211DRAFT_375731 [Terfezia boudieri ATCC MYA-4762]|uniref:Uncharacterized protein n=1 Tax=Terfezia boudieri ATCC MYA-4762 TaxID=1051890 RepID=A0A3N4M367_9PEZI|nr:hypothetical protein L211DRAFT_375731 [Terfezia boudieri ATCC MYA-4762]